MPSPAELRHSARFTKDHALPLPVFRAKNVFWIILLAVLALLPNPLLADAASGPAELEGETPGGSGGPRVVFMVQVSPSNAEPEPEPELPEPEPGLAVETASDAGPEVEMEPAFPEPEPGPAVETAPDAGSAAEAGEDVQAEEPEEPCAEAAETPLEELEPAGVQEPPETPPPEEGQEAGPASDEQTAAEEPQEPPAESLPPSEEPAPIGAEMDREPAATAPAPQVLVLLLEPSVFGSQMVAAQGRLAPSGEAGQRRGEGLVLGGGVAPCSIGICDFYNGRAIPGAKSLVLSKCGICLDAELGFRLFSRLAIFLDIGGMAVVKRLTVLPGAATVGHLVVEGGADALVPFKDIWEFGAGLSGGIMLGFNAGTASASPSLGARLGFSRRLNDRLAARLTARARVALNSSNDPLRRSATWLVDPLVLSLAFDL